MWNSSNKESKYKIGCSLGCSFKILERNSLSLNSNSGSLYKYSALAQNPLDRWLYHYNSEYQFSSSLVQDSAMSGHCGYQRLKREYRARTKILVIGNSHARRLVQSMRSNRNYSAYDIEDMTIPGARMIEIARRWPHEKLYNLGSRDIVIIQSLGNDVFKEGTHMITQNPRTIHLRRFEPTPDADFAYACCILRDLVDELAPRVIVLDNIFRYLCDCREHQYPGLIPHQINANRILHEVLQPSAEVLKTESLIVAGHRHRNVGTGERASWLTDAVHLRPALYWRVSENLLPIIAEVFSQPSKAVVSNSKTKFQANLAVNEESSNIVSPNVLSPTFDRWCCPLEGHETHLISDCAVFFTLTPMQRRHRMRDQGCYSCLGRGKDCSSRRCSRAQQTAQYMICKDCADHGGVRKPCCILLCGLRSHLKPDVNVLSAAVEAWIPNLIIGELNGPLVV